MTNYKIFILLGCVFFSCKKMVDVGKPKSQLTSSTVFNSDASAVAAQLAIYSQMESTGYPYSLSIYTGLSADEFTNYNTSVDYIDLFTNNLSKTNGNVYSLWTSSYKYIYEANAVMEGVSASKTLSQAVKQQLLGEAKFIRAFCHFYLLNLFGDIPVVTGTDYRINRLAPRQTASKVNESIINDLKEAESLLSEDYVTSTNKPTTDRIRPNKWAAASLLARAYMFAGDWANAEAQAGTVLSQSSKYSLQSNLDQVFLKNNGEAIWQLSSVLPGFNSYEGGYLILTATPSSISLSPGLVNSFDTSDKRKNSWVGSITVSGQTYFYPYKYKVGQNASSITEYSTLLRLAEIYLIRSEARAQRDNLSGSLDDLNVIRTRAGLPNATAGSKQQLLDLILEERRFELFSELGHRWLDLKRMSKTGILEVLKAPDWQSTDQLYPIPQNEINNNPSLTQNPGY